MDDLTDASLNLAAFKATAIAEARCLGHPTPVRDKRRRRVPPEDPPPWLSCLPGKLSLFAEDPAFVRGWRTISALHREGRFPIERLWNVGSLLFKADSILRGNAMMGLDLAEAAGFRIATGRAVTFTPSLVRQMWRYAAVRLTAERMQLLARLMACAPSFYALVEARPGDALPASLRLTAAKGDVPPVSRAPEHLRRAMGEPQSAMLNFLHTADEPADVVRELGLLVRNASERRRVVLEVAEGRSEEARAACRDLLRHVRHVDLDARQAISRVRTALCASPDLAAASARRLALRLDAVELGQAASWPPLRRALAEAQIAVSELDDIVIHASTVRLKRTVKREPFPSCEIRHWREAWPQPPQLA